MQDDNINVEYVKQLIRDEGGYVSVATPPGPVTVIFTKCLSPIKRQDSLGDYIDETFLRYEKYVIEYNTWLGENFEGFRECIKEIINSTTKTTIFSIYKVGKIGNKLMIRLGWLNYYYGEQQEVSLEEAQILLANPPDHVSIEFLQDIKALYNL